MTEDDIERDAADLEAAKSYYRKCEEDLAGARAWLSDAERRMLKHWDARVKRLQEHSR